MDAEGLYKRSLSGKRKKRGLGIRVSNTLIRGGCGSPEGGVDINMVYAMVLDGTIWAVNGIGETSVKQICEWLVKTRDSKSSNAQ